MTAAWVLADRETAADLQVFLARAARVDPEAVVRVMAVGSVAAAYVCVLRGAGMPTVLGLRTLGLAEPSTLDAVVPVTALLDRLARQENETRLPVPPQQVSSPWAGVLPPRAGWELVGDSDVVLLRRAAAAGIEEIAQGTPEGAGSAAVAQLRSMVWSRLIDGTELPAGVAFAADALGFLRVDGTTSIAVAGRWSRLSTAGGFVLWRQPLLG